MTSFFPNSKHHLFRLFLCLLGVCLTAETMKQSFCLSVFLLFLLYSSRSSARPMTNKQGKDEVNLSQMASEESLVQMEGSEIVDLMGLEICESSRDEECSKRRLTSEAHLDYIYTQHHKP